MYTNGYLRKRKCLALGRMFAVHGLYGLYKSVNSRCVYNCFHRREPAAVQDKLLNCRKKLNILF